MRQTRWYPIAYMFLVTAAFSSVVIGVADLTRERVEANVRLAFERAVVAVLPGLYEPTLSGPEIQRRFVEQVSEPDASSGGAYTLRKDGQIAAYALPFAGQGFWAPIRGVIGIAADKKTITGIAFYEQSETPGLGAEIVKPAFRRQFEGKVLAWEGKPINMRRPGAELGANDVYAVTGATQTSVRLEDIINQAVRDWQSKIGGEGARPQYGDTDRTHQEEPPGRALSYRATGRVAALRAEGVVEISGYELDVSPFAARFLHRGLRSPVGMTTGENRCESANEWRPYPGEGEQS